MKRILIYCFLLLLPLSMSAKKNVAVIKPVMSAEEEARFLYYFYEAQRLFSHKEYNKSFELFDFCYRLNPNDGMVNRYLGDFVSILVGVPQALSYYERSYQLDPKSEGIEERLEQCYYTIGDYKSALKMCDKIAKKPDTEAYVAWHRYMNYGSMGEYKKAIKVLEDYLKIVPYDLRFVLARVTLLEVTNAPAKKLKEAYEYAMSLDPQNVVIMNNYAYFLATHKGDLKVAEQMSQYTIQAEPNNPTYLDTYAWILYLRGEYLLAEMYIRQAMNMYPNGQIPEDILLHFNQITKKR